MEEDLRNLEEFWDNFAEEYHEIQEESPFPIAKDLKDYLLKENILPTNSFVDIAGGAGRYVAELTPYCQNYLFIDISKKMIELAKKKVTSPQVTFLHLNQETFFKMPIEKEVDILFSAMNPAFENPEMFRMFVKYPAKTHLILRLIEDYDSLFSPLEEEIPSLPYEKVALQKWHLPFKSQIFSYKVKEIVTKAFFDTYFEEVFSTSELKEISAHYFGEADEAENIRTVCYELLIF